jgi:hypothetical protein
MHRSRTLMQLVACSSWLLLVSSAAHTWAEPDAPAPQATPTAYDSFIDQAVIGYEAGRYAEARTLFRQAHEVMPTARTLRSIGMCSFNLGDYVDAVENLEAALHDARKPLTAEQQRNATDLIAQSNPHIGRFQLRLSPPTAALTVDGRTVTLNDRHELLLEPGRHNIEAHAPAYRGVQTMLNVGAGDRTTFELRLVVEPAGNAESEVAQPLAPARDASSGTQPSSQNATTQGSTQTTIGFVTLGVGVAALVAGGVVSALAISKQSKLHDRCPNRLCGPSYYADVDSYDTLKTVSTVTLIAGGAATVLGGVLLLIRGDRPSEHAAAIEPTLGFGSLGVRGQL